MKKGLLGGIGLAVVIIAGLICVAKCSVRVPAGYIAVEYKMNGGISKNVLTQGWHLISPTVKTSLYSVGIEQSYLTSEDKGDSPKDESFKTPTADGKSLQVDLEFSYKWLCRGFKSFQSVKIMKKHPWFYTKIFRLKNMKKARKYGLFEVSIHLVSPIWCG
mgnify:CR=1 FL=1